MDESPGPMGWNVFRCAPPSPSVKPAAIASMIARSSLVGDRAVASENPDDRPVLVPRARGSGRTVARLAWLNAALPSPSGCPRSAASRRNIPSSSAFVNDEVYRGRK